MEGSDWRGGEKTRKKWNASDFFSASVEPIKANADRCILLFYSGRQSQYPRERERESNLLLTNIDICVHVWFGPVAANEIDSTAADALSNYAATHHSSPPITNKQLASGAKFDSACLVQ